MPYDSNPFVLVYDKLLLSTYKYLTVSTVAPQLVLRLYLAQSTLSIPLYLCLAWAHTLFLETLNTLTIVFTDLFTHVK
jgi:hypothetical protein